MITLLLDAALMTLGLALVSLLCGLGLALLLSAAELSRFVWLRCLRTPNPSWGTGTYDLGPGLERLDDLLTPHGERERPRRPTRRWG